MKKIITIILSAIILLTSLVLPVSATSKGIIKAGRVSAKRGEEISIPVSLERNPGIFIIRVTVSFDEKAVEYVKIKKSASDSFNYTINEEANSIVVLLDGQKMSNVTGDLELFELKFKVKSDAPFGKTLFKVSCDKGMASALVTKDDTITPTPVSLATSTGAVTVICSKHTFDVEMNDGSFRCSECGAIKTAESKVEVDVDAGLPEIDVSTSPSQTDTSIVESDTQNGENGDKSGFKFGHLIPIISAVLIAVLIPTAIAISKKKKNETDTK